MSDLSSITNKGLIEIWYRAMSNVNKNVKNSEIKFEKILSIKIKNSLEGDKPFIYEFLLFSRSIYGHRFNPKS